MARIWMFCRESTGISDEKLRFQVIFSNNVSTPSWTRERWYLCLIYIAILDVNSEEPYLIYAHLVIISIFLASGIAAVERQRCRDEGFGGG